MRAFRAATGTAPAPLVIVLHGYGADGTQLQWFGLDGAPAASNAHLLAPDGTLDNTGRRFWNAVETCCDFESKKVDDVAYLTSLIDDVAARHPVDRARVYAVGLSNGGAMALRLVCDASDRFAAVVSIAAPWSATAACSPAHKVAIRHMHGTGDSVVPYNGGAIATGLHPNAKGSLPPAKELTAAFAKRNGCDEKLEDERRIDLDPSVPGLETFAARFTGCPKGAEVELWTLAGSAHVPPLNATFAAETWKFLSAHQK